MSFDDLLINTCTIKRFTEGAKDAYGHPVLTWANLHTNIICRHISGKGREIKVGQEVVIVYDELMVKNIDVTEQDQVVIGTKTYNILSVLFGQDGTSVHHKLLFLEIVK